MYDIELPGVLSGLYNTGYGISRLLTVMALVVAVALFVQRNKRLGLAFIPVTAVMGYVSWDLHRITVAVPREATVHGVHGDINPFNDYGVVLRLQPLTPTLILALLVLLAVIVCIVCAVMRRKALTAGAGIVAAAALLVVNAELVRADNSMYPSFWEAMGGVSKGLWIAFVITTLIYVVAAGVIVYLRALKQQPPKKLVSSETMSGGGQTATR